MWQAGGSADIARSPQIDDGQGVETVLQRRSRGPGHSV